MTDPAKVLPSQRRQALEVRLDRLQQDSKLDLAILVAPIGLPIGQLANDCFNHWSIGKSWEGGVLLVVTPDFRESAVMLSVPSPLSRKTLEALNRLRQSSPQPGPASLDWAITLVEKDRAARKNRPGFQLKVVAGNPPVPNIEGHVTDPSKKLKESDRVLLEQDLNNLQGDTQLDLAVLIAPRPAESLLDLGQACFQTWNIGRDWPQGGLLLIISHDLKQCLLIESPSGTPLSAKAKGEITSLVQTRLDQGELAQALGNLSGRVRNLVGDFSPQAAGGNPSVPGIESHLTDAGRFLTSKDRERIDTILGQIQAETKVDVVIHILNSRVESLPQMAQTCFETWGVGKSWAGGGVLLLVSRDLKDCALVASDSKTPFSQDKRLLLERELKARLQKQALANDLTFFVTKVRRFIEASGRRPTIYPAFSPNVEGTRSYLGASLAIALAALVSSFIRRRRHEP